MRVFTDINWAAVAAVVFTVAGFVVFFLPGGAYDGLLLPMGVAAIVSSILNVNWILDKFYQHFKLYAASRNRNHE